MKIINAINSSLFSLGLAALALLAMNGGLQAQTLPCPNSTNGVKFLLLPNISGTGPNIGLDIKDSRNNIVLADDFICTNTGPITDIHLWGSWLNDLKGPVTNFVIYIYSDVPVVTNAAGQIITPSHPGSLLWWTNFPLGQYLEGKYAPANELFYNPTNKTVLGPDTNAWYYCFYPANPFVQQGSVANPTIYWLAVRAQLLPNDGSLYG